MTTGIATAETPVVQPDSDLEVPDFSLAGKNAFVTGSSRGIGRAIAEHFAREGAAVAVTYVTEAAAAEEVVGGITASGGAAMALRLDVADRAEVESAVAGTP